MTDEQRPGAPATFTFEQFMQIMALACETPASADRPVSSWTPRELADEAVKRGDEMTGIQALSRLHLSLPIQPGHVERQEFEYERHDSQV